MTCDINKNLLQGAAYRVNFDRLESLSFFATHVNLPGLSLSPARAASPFVDRSAPGDKLQFDPLQISFLVNETLSPWLDMYAWIRACGFPTTFAEYRELRKQNPLDKTRPQYTDGSVTIFSAKNNPILQVRFVDVVPVSLSELSFAATSTPQDAIRATARFDYAYYDLMFYGA